jgi:hypothetical protein
MKTKIWFIYEGVTHEGRLSSTTKKVIKLVNDLEKTYDKKMFDLRSIEYVRFLSESKKELCVKKSELPVVLIDEKIIFKNRLPALQKLKKEVDKIKGACL